MRRRKRSRRKKYTDDKSVQKVIKSNTKFFSWIQEFTKKIVTVTFILFVFSELFILGLVLLAYLQTSELSNLDILISETNQTFREVIGGYIIKAACENAIKIVGSVVEKYLDNKYTETQQESEDIDDTAE